MGAGLFILFSLKPICFFRGRGRQRQVPLRVSMSLSAPVSAIRGHRLACALGMLKEVLGCELRALSTWVQLC